MIHMVTIDNRNLYRTQLDEMHRLRKIHFVDERGWSGMTVRDGGEYDECDDERTIYFFALDEDGRIGVSMRARPTEDKCILTDVFPQLISPAEPNIKAPGVWEISRIFATRKFRSRRGIRKRSELFLATIEAAARQGVTRLVGMTDVYLLPQTLAAGWNVRVLGLPAAYPEGDVIGVVVDSSESGLIHMRERLGVAEPVVFHLTAESPLAKLPPEQAEAITLATRGLDAVTLRLLKNITRRVVELQDTHSDEEIISKIEGLISRWSGQEQRATSGLTE